MFRKPKRNVRQRQVDDDDDDGDSNDVAKVMLADEDDDPSLEELQSSIAKFKELKEKKSKKDKKKASSKVDSGGVDKDKKAPTQLLSFDEDLTAAGKTEKNVFSPSVMPWVATLLPAIDHDEVCLKKLFLGPS